MREWVGADKEVAEKVEVKTEQQKATATDERKGRRETTTKKKQRKKREQEGKYGKPERHGKVRGGGGVKSC